MEEFAKLGETKELAMKSHVGVMDYPEATLGELNKMEEFATAEKATWRDMVAAVLAPYPTLAKVATSALAPLLLLPIHLLAEDHGCALPRLDYSLIQPLCDGTAQPTGLQKVWNAGNGVPGQITFHRTKCQTIFLLFVQ